MVYIIKRWKDYWILRFRPVFVLTWRFSSRSTATESLARDGPMSFNWPYIDFPSTVLFTSAPEVYADIHKFPEDKTHWCGFYRHKLSIISWKFNFNFKKEKITFDPNSQCDNPCWSKNNQWILREVSGYQIGRAQCECYC